MYKKVIMAIQVAALLPVLLCAFSIVKAQINFVNPSFEGDTTGPYTPPGWQIFEFKVGTLPDKRYTYLDYFPAYNGKTYIGICQAYSGDSVTKEGFYQTLPCTLYKNINYSLSFYATSLDVLENPHKYRRGGGFSIWLSNDSLLKDQLIYRVCELDTNRWTKITVPFTPFRNYNTMIFESYQTCDSNSGYRHPVFFDYLSPITYINKDYIKIYTRTNTINYGDTLSMKARFVKDIGVTLTWQSLPPGLYSSDRIVTVKPKQNTKYIVTGNFSCGLQVSDTVEVAVDYTSNNHTHTLNPNALIEYVEGWHSGGDGTPPPYIQTYITKGENWIIQSANTPLSVKVFNAIGQFLYSNDNYNNNLYPSLLNWATGIYFYSITYGSGDIARGKMIFINN